MKQQLQALGSAIGMYVLSLMPFGLGYFFIAVSLYSGHGATQVWYDLIGYAWLALAVVVPLWIAAVSYRKVIREQP